MRFASGVAIENDHDVADTLLNEENNCEQHFLNFSRTNLLSENPDIFTKPRNKRAKNKTPINE